LPGSPLRPGRPTPVPRHRADAGRPRRSTYRPPRTARRTLASHPVEVQPSRRLEGIARSYHGVMVRRRIAAGDEMLELAFDIGEQRRSAEAGQGRAEATVPQLFLHQDEPFERLPGLADPARRLEPHRV